nr:hypothetical protein CFP56_77639 [Quercus suber]
MADQYICCQPAATAFHGVSTHTLYLRGWCTDMSSDFPPTVVPWNPPFCTGTGNRHDEQCDQQVKFCGFCGSLNPGWNGSEKAAPVSTSSHSTDNDVVFLGQKQITLSTPSYSGTRSSTSHSTVPTSSRADSADLGKPATSYTGSAVSAQNSFTRRHQLDIPHGLAEKERQTGFVPKVHNFNRIPTSQTLSSITNNVVSRPHTAAYSARSKKTTASKAPDPISKVTMVFASVPVKIHSDGGIEYQDSPTIMHSYLHIMQQSAWQDHCMDNDGPELLIRFFMDNAPEGFNTKDITSLKGYHRHYFYSGFDRNESLPIAMHGGFFEDAGLGTKLKDILEAFPKGPKVSIMVELDSDPRPKKKKKKKPTDESRIMIKSETPHVPRHRSISVELPSPSQIGAIRSLNTKRNGADDSVMMTNALKRKRDAEPGKLYGMDFINSAVKLAQESGPRTTTSVSSADHAGDTRRACQQDTATDTGVMAEKSSEGRRSSASTSDLSDPPADTDREHIGVMTRSRMRKAS